MYPRPEQGRQFTDAFPSPQHSLDRINNDGNYEPGNCRWATDSVQNLNKRNNPIFVINGRSATMREWADISGTRYNMIQQRLLRGWPIELAVFAPPMKRWSRVRGVINAQ